MGGEGQQVTTCLVPSVWTSCDGASVEMLSSCEAKLVPFHNAGAGGRLQRDGAQSERILYRRWGRRRSNRMARWGGGVLFLSFSDTHSATRSRKCVLYGRQIGPGCVCACISSTKLRTYQFFYLLRYCTSGKKNDRKTTQFVSIHRYVNGKARVKLNLTAIKSHIQNTKTTGTLIVMNSSEI
jgi:hypothetical protein